MVPSPRRSKRKKTIRVLIAGASVYNPNRGVDALASASIALFHSILSEVGKDFEIYVYNKEFIRERDTLLMPNGNPIRFRNIYPVDIFSARGVFKTIVSKSKLYYLKEFLKCDYVFNIMAGDGFSDLYGSGVMRTLSQINKLCRLFHKPYYLLPQTYGPFILQDSLNFAKKECLSAKLLMSRDKESTDLLKKGWGLPNVLDLIDIAFSLPYRLLKKEPDSIHIGINISETLCKKHEGHKFLIKETYLPIMKRVIVQLLADGYKVHLIPHVADRENRPQNEYYLQYKLWEDIQHPGLIPPPFFLSACDAKSYISSMDLFIGSRMHACIAAYSSNVPVLPLGYSKKFSGLFSETLKYPFLIDLTKDFSENSILSVIQEMLDNLPEIESDLRNKNKVIVSPRLNTLRQAIKDILNG